VPEDRFNKEVNMVVEIHVVGIAKEG